MEEYAGVQRDRIYRYIVWARRTVLHTTMSLSYLGECESAKRVRRPISRCLEVLVSVCVPVVDRETEGVTGTGGDDAEGCWVLMEFV